MYASADDLYKRYGENAVQTAAWDNEAQAVDMDAIISALADATEEVNAYLRKFYALPLKETPTVLTRVTADIAMYRLSPTPAEVTTEQRTRYDDAMKFLHKISSGEITLGLPTTQKAPGGGRNQWRYNGRRFNEDTLRDL